ncbi:Re/Si-specific NAD(P)(+) transhydrogenase subunit alpha [Fodinicola acaciae]|uniref:Re/Si-specific NAD(P)(+) transhydrogenase subunit alpha n=1 Tax=Fodinicola acaciae TaxID=2681555 RepID=UPI0013D0D5E3|nr:Re/Si-specific NAD(P)(+) transhydrogenase subunit alpha [Fodinicola acaciae]
MRLAVRKESRPGERRVALLPSQVEPLVKLGFDVVIESGAGVQALAPDDAYAEAGATVVTGSALSDADVVLHVRPLQPDDIGQLRQGAVTIGFATPSAEPDGVKALRAAGVTAFSMELVPRISRAQSMDALTSQALVAGYRCVLEAAMRLPKFFPLFMTAAGTIPPARALVLGAGVAGLQAIATAKRLGAVVEAYDVRPSSADEVKSMGATFIKLELEAIEGAGGYAREMTEDRAKRQQELLTPYIAKADVLITTAAVPGRPAPRLVTTAMLEQMAAGSVVVDLAAESGGNVEGSVPGKDIRVGGATLVGMADASSTMPVDASRLYGKNVTELLKLLVKEEKLDIDFDDEVVAGACLTHDGAIRHEPTRQQIEGDNG